MHSYMCFPVSLCWHLQLTHAHHPQAFEVLHARGGWQEAVRGGGGGGCSVPDDDGVGGVGGGSGADGGGGGGRANSGATDVARGGGGQGRSGRGAADGKRAGQEGVKGGDQGGEAGQGEGEDESALAALARRAVSFWLCTCLCHSVILEPHPAPGRPPAYQVRQGHRAVRQEAAKVAVVERKVCCTALQRLVYSRRCCGGPGVFSPSRL